MLKGRKTQVPSPPSPVSIINGARSENVHNHLPMHTFLLTTARSKQKWNDYEADVLNEDIFYLYINSQNYLITK